MSRIARRLMVPTPPLRPAANATLSLNDVFIVVSAQGITLTLPRTSDVPGGEIFIALASGVTSYTIRAQGSDLVSNETLPNGASSITLTSENVIVYSNGSNRWYLTRG